MLSWSGGIRGPRHPAVTITRRSGWYSAPIVLLHSTELPYICLSSTIQRSVLAVAQADGMPAHSGGNLWTLPLLCSWFLQIVFHQFIRQFHSMYNVHTLPMANAHFITVAMNVIISPEAHSWIGSAIDFRDVGRKVWKLFWKFDGTSGKKGVRHRENELLKKLFQIVFKFFTTNCAVVDHLLQVWHSLQITKSLTWNSHFTQNFSYPFTLSTFRDCCKKYILC